MSTNIKTDAYIALGNKTIDDTHREFITLLLELNNAPKESFTNSFATFLGHIEQHFSQEETLMQDSNDPNLAEHMSEHRRVLNKLKLFEKRIAAGKSNFAKAYLKDKLPEWFKLHTTTMDSALVSHLKNNVTSIE